MEDTTLLGLEQQLQFSLRKVNPDPQFVSVLHRRLTVVPAVTIERSTQMRAFVVTGLGVFCGALLFWTLHRFWLWIRIPLRKRKS